MCHRFFAIGFATLWACAPGPAGSGEGTAGDEAPGTHGRHAHGHDHGEHHDFSDVERFAAIFDDPERDAWQKPDEVVALLGLSEGAIVADLGAGTGYFLARLSASVGPGGRVLALDTEPAMVAHMRERAAREGLDNVEAIQVPPDGPGVDARSVDAFLVVDTWHHLPERTRYAQALRRALRDGGQVLVVDFTEDAPHGPPPSMRLSAETVADELRAAGFTTEVVAETLPHQYVVRGRAP